MSHSDSEFEQVGWSDLESLNGGCTGGDKEEDDEITHVELELPPHLLDESRERAERSFYFHKPSISLLLRVNRAVIKLL